MQDPKQEILRLIRELAKTDQELANTLQDIPQSHVDAIANAVAGGCGPGEAVRTLGSGQDFDIEPLLRVIASLMTIIKTVLDLWKDYNQDRNSESSSTRPEPTEQEVISSLPEESQSDSELTKSVKKVMLVVKESEESGTKT